MDNQIDVTAVLDKMSAQIGAQAREIAMTQALAEQQGKVIQEQLETIQSQSDTIRDQQEKLDAAPEIIEEPKAKTKGK